MASPVNRSELDTLSLETSYFQIPGHICWTVIGSMALIGNALVVCTIVKTKSLHTKCMWSLASLASCDWVCGLAFTVQGVKKLYLISREIPETSPQIVCFLWGAPASLLSSISDVVTMGLNLDRFLATAIPIAYKTRLDNRYVIILNFMCWLTPTAYWMMAFDMENPNKLLPVCFGSSSPDKWFQNLYTKVRWGIVALNMFFYLAALIVLRQRLVKTRSMSLPERRQAREAMEIGMIKTMGAISFLYVSLKLLGYALTTYAVALGGNMLLKLNSFTGIPVIMYSASHLPIYLLMCKSFRQAFVRGVLRQGQSSVLVIPAGVSFPGASAGVP